MLLGFVMSMFPALMQPTIEKIADDDSLALGHFGSSCYFISAQIDKLFAGGKSSEDVSFPKGLSFLRDNTISIAIVMFFCHIVVAGVETRRGGENLGRKQPNCLFVTAVDNVLGGHLPRACGCSLADSRNRSRVQRHFGRAYPELETRD